MAVGRWIAIALLVSAGQAAAALPATVQAELPGLRAVGSGAMRWFGFKLYDATLWRGAALALDEVPYGQTFALELNYARSISGEQLVKASIEEMQRLGWRDPARLSRWQQQLAAVFPDVQSGDRITGLYLPGQGARFYFGERPLGEVNDAEFARAFFAIWLDPRTRAPALLESMRGTGS
jgi:hypothetical protein